MKLNKRKINDHHIELIIEVPPSELNSEMPVQRKISESLSSVLNTENFGDVFRVIVKNVNFNSKEKLAFIADVYIAPDVQLNDWKESLKKLKTTNKGDIPPKSIFDALLEQATIDQIPSEILYMSRNQDDSLLYEVAEKKNQSSEIDDMKISRLKLEFIFKKIAKTEKIEITNEELSTEIKKRTDHFGSNSEEIENIRSDNYRQYVSGLLLLRKTMDHIQAIANDNK